MGKKKIEGKLCLYLLHATPADLGRELAGLSAHRTKIRSAFQINLNHLSLNLGTYLTLDLFFVFLRKLIGKPPNALSLHCSQAREELFSMDSKTFFMGSSRGFRKEQAGLPHCCGVSDSHGRVGRKLGELKTFRHFVLYLGLVPGLLAIVALLLMVEGHPVPTGISGGLSCVGQDLWFSLQREQSVLL